MIAMTRPNQQVHAAIAEAMRARIGSGEWAVGKRLPSIQQLAQEFGVGTSSIREATRTLATEGAIRIEHGRGMFVADEAPRQPNPYRHFHANGTASILAFCEARRILEPELAALAAERASPMECQSIWQLATAMEGLLADPREHMEQVYIATDLQFHREIARGAHNPVLIMMTEGVNDLLLESHQLLATRQPRTLRRATKYHTLIAEAIRDRSPLQARLLMLAHVNDTIDALISLQTSSEDRQRAQGSLAASSALVINQRSLIDED
jgi:GntR family transcriptional regulator, transcriptional repressor for pyruvate dehydrogenase complex